jgi:hypothetical protein
LNIRATIITGHKQINHTVFHRAFRGASFEKKFKALSFS